MTLKPEVMAALKRANFEAGRCTKPYDVFPISRADWTTLSAELLAMDAELQMTRRVHRWNTERSGENLQVCRDEHDGDNCEWETFVPIERAQKAESRIAEMDAKMVDVGAIHELIDGMRIIARLTHDDMTRDTFSNVADKLTAALPKE